MKCHWLFSHQRSPVAMDLWKRSNYLQGRKHVCKSCLNQYWWFGTKFRHRNLQESWVGHHLGNKQYTFFNIQVFTCALAGRVNLHGRCLQSIGIKTDNKCETIFCFTKMLSLCPAWFIPLISAQGLQGSKEYAGLVYFLRHCGVGNGPYETWLPVASGLGAVRPAQP